MLAALRCVLAHVHITVGVGVLALAMLEVLAVLSNVLIAAGKHAFAWAIRLQTSFDWRPRLKGRLSTAQKTCFNVNKNVQRRQTKHCR